MHRLQEWLFYALSTCVYLSTMYPHIVHNQRLRVIHIFTGIIHINCTICSPAKIRITAQFSGCFHRGYTFIHESYPHFTGLSPKIVHQKNRHNCALHKKISTFLSLLYTENVDRLCIDIWWIVTHQSTGRLQSMWTPVARQI